MTKVPLCVHEQTRAGESLHELTLEFLTERVRRELIRERVQREVKEFNRRRDEVDFRGLV